MKKMLIWVLVGFLIAVCAIRAAPSDPARWHIVPVADVDHDMKGGVVRIVETGPDGLDRLHSIARETPRTYVLTGSVDEGMVTYVTRSKVIGFPDYTTVQQDGDMLRIHGRLRFGRSDFGVNRDRVDRWLAALQPG